MKHISFLLALLGCTALRAVPALGQTPGETPIASRYLPDAPEPAGPAGNSQAAQAVASANDPNQPVPHRPKVARPFDKSIDAGAQAPRLTVGDKILLGMRATVAPIAISGWVAGASISEARDSRPNYPDTLGGFGQRLGAAAARSASDTIITDSVLSSILHEDPRYYKLGVGHGVWERTGYALSRVFFTRTDSGRRTPNLALLIGDVAGASITQFYYPKVNRGVGDVAETYATSLLAAGIGFYVREFIGKWLYVIHLRPDYT